MSFLDQNEMPYVNEDRAITRILEKIENANGDIDERLVSLKYEEWRLVTKALKNYHLIPKKSGD